MEIFGQKNFIKILQLFLTKLFLYIVKKNMFFFVNYFLGFLFCNFRFFRKLLAFLFFENIFFRIFCPPLRVIIAFEKFLKNIKFRRQILFTICASLYKRYDFFGYFLWDFLWEECVEIFEISFFLVDLADPRNLDIFQFQNDTHILGPRYLPGLGRR